MNQKVNSLIQFAKRARNIAFKQTLHHFLNKNKVGVVLIASDISENTLAEFNNHKKVKFITSYERHHGRACSAGVFSPRIQLRAIRIYGMRGGDGAE